MGLKLIRSRLDCTLKPETGFNREMGECNSGSSSEEDGDLEWKAAISSAAAGASSFMSSLVNGVSATENNGGGGGDNKQSKTQQQLPKHYQIKAQKILDEIIGKNLEIVSDPLIHLPDDEPMGDNEEEGCIRLFKNAPPGIVFDHVDPQPLRRRPRILPGKVINEKSKKFKRQLQSVAVDGKDILAAARDKCQTSLSRQEAKDAAAKAAAKREEERVAQLKKIRGEKWLPCIAKEMKLKSNH
ncbi:uncharacterized protein LOC103945754 [Pyrus x bretschneideri]|uniref:uncharacterized protein LOC103945754 n=1 Tax=Pyrus x bretschneideri TaxID=225117 RepID=UPI00202FDCE7|nr:uncharacterized protein LOC103945754 [Pyrus x bretschneideri]